MTRATVAALALLVVLLLIAYPFARTAAFVSAAFCLLMLGSMALYGQVRLWIYRWRNPR